MPIFVYQSRLTVPAAELFAWHRDPAALPRLLPPRPRVTLEQAPADLTPGSRAVLAIHAGPWRVRWEAEHTAFADRGTAGGSFTDVQRRGPFRRWIHDHIVTADGPAHSLLRDSVRWDLPRVPGWLARPLVHSRLRAMFRWRHAATAAALGARIESA